MKKNLVIGSASGYAYYTLEPLITSFMKNCPSAELVLFVNDLSDFTRDKIIAIGGDRIKLEPSEFVNNPITDRWKNFLDYLEAHGNDYEQVLCVDTRDVIFQGDVFKAFENHSSYLGYALDSDDVRGSKSGIKTNYNWLIAFFSKDEADKLADKPNINCGTVIGTVEEMKTFLRTMVKYIPLPITGTDQATQHYITYNNLLPIKNLIGIDSISGEIFTCLLFYRQYPIKIRDNMILRGDGGVPAIVHQYDRRTRTNQLVNSVYRDRSFLIDERFSDPRSKLEQITQLLLIDKINDAAMLLMKTDFVDACFDDKMTDLFIKLWNFLLGKPYTPVVGYLELYFQNAFLSVKELSADLEMTCGHLNYLIREKRVIDQQFIQFIVRSLLDTAEQNLNAKNRRAICEFCTNWINYLPPNKNIYLLKAEAYRAFGNKDEALENYKKLLELS